ncbi:MAG: IS110 family transposase [Pirellula sp.]|jgi:transposase|nr:IS110 family transposase [Pirellula sp.]
MIIQESKVYAGVDVASKHLDLFFPDTGRPERIKNDADAVKALCVRIEGKSQYMFVMEASCGYESLLCAQLGSHGILRSVVNARCVNQFARSMVADAKTNQVWEKK